MDKAKRLHDSSFARKRRGITKRIISLREKLMFGRLRKKRKKNQKK